MRAGMVLMMAAALPCVGQRFEHLGTYRGLGALVASAVGPGAEAGSERIYLSYLYVENTIDVVAVDPRRGRSEVFPNPAPTESGARCMAIGPDGNVYLGTLPQAHLLKLDVKRGKLIDLGRPSPTESYIWDVAFGPDGKLYGATYPQSKLVRYDPASGRLEDLGRMDPQELYAHYVAGSDDGFMYVGIGTSKANIAAYEIATGSHREILPAEFRTVGQASVYRARDGKVYGKLGNNSFRLEKWTATPIPASEAPPAVPANVLRDGGAVDVESRTIRVTYRDGKVNEKQFDYAGNLLNVFRLGFGPDARLYGSSVLPIYLLRLDEPKGVLAELGGLGGGEIYSFLSHGGRLLAAAYAGHAPLMSFDPGRPFRATGDRNPALISFPGSDSGWRPEAMIEGPDGKVYLGAVSGYGKLGGPLAAWDTEAGTVELLAHVVQDQSVITLAVWRKLIGGGTTIAGGGGSHTTAKEARLFLWDPGTRKKIFETVPVAGARQINDLIAAPNGLLYGIAGRTLFVFDPAAREIKVRKQLPFSRTIYNAIAVGPDRKLWGLAAAGIFRIDPETNDAVLIASAPKPVTAGFALRDGKIYFASNAEVWRWTLPGL